MVKICRACKEEKGIEEFPRFSTSEAGRKNTCKICTNRLSALRAQLKTQNPAPEAGPCPICKNYTENWILDHCHFTDCFRGYICNSCNLAIGRFNDDIELLENAINYLKTNLVS
jgi:hypothetical protein